MIPGGKATSDGKKTWWLGYDNFCIEIVSNESNANDSKYLGGIQFMLLINIRAVLRQNFKFLDLYAPFEGFLIFQISISSSLS